jgi:hypothetical protein
MPLEVLVGWSLNRWYLQQFENKKEGRWGKEGERELREGKQEIKKGRRVFMSATSAWAQVSTREGFWGRGSDTGTSASILSFGKNKKEEMRKEKKKKKIESSAQYISEINKKG